MSYDLQMAYQNPQCHDLPRHQVSQSQIDAYLDVGLYPVIRSSPRYCSATDAVLPIPDRRIVGACASRDKAQQFIDMVHEPSDDDFYEIGQEPSFYVVSSGSEWAF